MFEGFEQQVDPKARKRLFASTGASLAALVIVGGVVVAFAGGEVVKRTRAPVEVAFHKPTPKPKAPPPPPPPPPPPKASKRPAKIAGNAPATPDELSDERLAEGDERDFRSQLGTMGTDAIVQAGGALEKLLAPRRRHRRRRGRPAARRSSCRRTPRRQCRRTPIRDRSIPMTPASRAARAS
jgi:hypothetical protein